MWNGASGGAAAADKLYLAVQTHFEHLDAGRARQWKIVVRVYLDVYGLFQRLRVAGYSHDLERLYQFARGFTQRQALFDLVDVGHGSQQVPIKMEGDLSHLLVPFFLITDFFHLLKSSLAFT